MTSKPQVVTGRYTWKPESPINHLARLTFEYALVPEWRHVKRLRLRRQYKKIKAIQRERNQLNKTKRDV